MRFLWLGRHETSYILIDDFALNIIINTNIIIIIIMTAITNV